MKKRLLSLALISMLALPSFAQKQVEADVEVKRIARPDSLIQLPSGGQIKVVYQKDKYTKKGNIILKDPVYGKELQVYMWFREINEQTLVSALELDLNNDGRKEILIETVDKYDPLGGSGAKLFRSFCLFQLSDDEKSYKKMIMMDFRNKKAIKGWDSSVGMSSKDYIKVENNRVYMYTLLDDGSYKCITFMWNKKENCVSMFDDYQEVKK